MGTWDWGNYTVHFDGDDTWGAIDKKTPSYEKFGGTWSISGDEVALGYVGSAPPGSSDSTFNLSEDGSKLVAVTGDTGVMRKRLVAAN